ncbi:MAG TPA: ACT domain-containing protein [Woeseiaceae bacterium]|nr:ACT domain-containing protein [Woeseiaceae bacterium]
MNPVRTDAPSHPASDSTAVQRRAILPALNLLLADREGALVRILGLVERRGFRFGAISTRLTPRGMQLSLTLASDDRPADVLLRQVARLQDVLEAALDVQRQPHAS